LAVGVLLGATVYFGAIGLLFGMAWYFANRAFGENRLPHRGTMPAGYYRDAFWIGLGGAAGILGLERLLAFASTYWPTAHRSLEASFGQDFDALIPIAATLGAAVFRGLLFTGLVAAIASFVAAQVRHRLLRFSLLVFGALAVVGGGWGTPADLMKQFMARLILLGVLAFGVRRLMRFNILGCFLVVACTTLVSTAAELLVQPDSFYRANGYAIMLALALLFLWPLGAWRLRGANAPT
jgi:hypothetical protein